STAQEAVRNVKEMVTDPEIQKNQHNNIELTKMYMYDHMGATENVVRRFESALAGKAGVSRQTVKNFTEVLRAGVYIKTLSLSAGYAIATPFQA
ncbi:hypothetical protein OE165_26885, partial [Escherichia coli]|uniref:hypothetical protein n=1 Tax=Escherichia coli TaxID=562 RepID=UPI0021F392CE